MNPFFLYKTINLRIRSPSCYFKSSSNIFIICRTTLTKEELALTIPKNSKADEKEMKNIQSMITKFESKNRTLIKI